MLQPDFKVRISHLLGSMSCLVGCQVELSLYLIPHFLLPFVLLPFCLSSLFPFAPPAESTSTPSKGIEIEKYFLFDHEVIRKLSYMGGGN